MNLLKSVHVGQQFACGGKKDSDTLTAPIQIVLYYVHATELFHGTIPEVSQELFWETFTLHQCNSSRNQLLNHAEAGLCTVYVLRTS